MKTCLRKLLKDPDKFDVSNRFSSTIYFNCFQQFCEVEFSSAER